MASPRLSRRARRAATSLKALLLVEDGGNEDGSESLDPFAELDFLDRMQEAEGADETRDEFLGEAPHTGDTIEGELNEGEDSAAGTQRKSSSSGTEDSEAASQCSVHTAELGELTDLEDWRSAPPEPGHPTPPAAAAASSARASPEASLEATSRLPQLRLYFEDGAGNKHSIRYDVTDAALIAEKCTSTRMTTVGRKEGQGRPLVFLTHWLLSAASHDGKAEHKMASMPSYAGRLDSRRRFVVMPNSGVLLAIEAAAADGHGVEPPEFA